MALVNCPNCGRLVSDTLSNCPGCNASLEAEEATRQNDQIKTIYVNTSNYGNSNSNSNGNNSNGLGVAGFVLALIGLFIGFVPILGWIIWLLGAIFSFAGLFKRPRGFAIAGFVISFIDLLLLLLVFGAGLSLLGALGAIGAAAS